MNTIRSETIGARARVGAVVVLLSCAFGGMAHAVPICPLVQNLDPHTIVDGMSVACRSDWDTTRDTSWWRVFDLDEAGHVATTCVNEVVYAVESAVGPQNVTVNLYCLDDGLPFLKQFLTPADTNTQAQPDASLELFEIEVQACCDAATQSMVLELQSDDCAEEACTEFLVGVNDLGQTGPSYISGPDCEGLDGDPVDLNVLGFSDVHVLMYLRGEIDCGDDCPPPECCPDKILEYFEECDDGNDVDGDGCDSNCTPTGCGNGVVTEGEQCDDGNDVDDDACANDCTVGVPVISRSAALALMLLILTLSTVTVIRRHRRSGTFRF